MFLPVSWFAGTRRDKQSHGRDRSGKEQLGDLAVEAAGFISIALILLAFTVQTVAVQAVTFSVAGISLVVVVLSLWRRWRPATKGLLALVLVLACVGAGVLAYLIEIR